MVLHLLTANGQRSTVNPDFHRGKLVNGQPSKPLFYRQHDIRRHPTSRTRLNSYLSIDKETVVVRGG